MTNILDILRNPTPEALPVVKAIVRQHPYYHLAHLALLKLLYQMRDPAYNDELRTAALYLPSRQTIYNLVEGNALRPMSEEELQQHNDNGATLSRKPNQRLSSIDSTANSTDTADTAATTQPTTDRTGTLLDSFLTGTTATTGKTRPARPIDATVDYISYMLQEQESMAAAANEAQANEERHTAVSPTSTDAPQDEKTAATPQPQESHVATPSPATAKAAPQADEKVSKATAAPAEPTPAETSARDGQQAVVDSFIEKHGDRRIRLKDKKESELQKPKLDVDNGSQGGAFTETLARIYIKQGKYEHAIDIIQRLALKYPNKNRYYNDQIRFLSKIIANSKAAQ